MILALWLLSLPFRFLAALGLRRSVILACLFVLTVTAHGVAEDLGLLEPPAQAAPARQPAAGQPTPSRAAVADIPAGYLRLYRQSGDLLIYASSGPSRRHVAMVVGRGRIIEALGRGIPVRSTSIRPGYLGAVRPGSGGR